MSQERHSSLGIHPVETDDAHELLKRRQVARRMRIGAIVVLVLLGIAAANTAINRASTARALEASSKEQSKQYVKVMLPRPSGSGNSVLLPGTLQGFMQSPISARSSGYLRRWYKDIGSSVTKGELLAEIDTPEVDQQLSQAQAAREQAAASLALAQSTRARWESLRAKDVVSQQELDERRGAEAQAKANLAAADANVERLRELEAFKRIVAPFAGVITRRNVDVGDLIDAGGGRPMFQLAQTDPLRLYVNVPQSYAQSVKAGQKVVVTQAELPGRQFQGQVTRTAASIEAVSRTMQVEVVLPNRDGVLLPGALVQVSLPIEGTPSLVVPTNSVLFRREGPRLAVVDDAGMVRLQTVRLGRDFGETVEVVEGLASTDRIVLNPQDSLSDGDHVLVGSTKEGA